MAVYSIKDLENFTQIKAHTLRIWEQRYNLLAPERTDTNIRLYSERDLKKILNINLLYSNGLKISKIAQLTEEEIFKLANEMLTVTHSEADRRIDNFINLIIRFDEKMIRKELNRYTKLHSFEETFGDVIVPVLKKVGELWQVDSISVPHEHFFSNIIREFIIRSTHKDEAKKRDKGRVVLFLHEEEYHEISLLFYNYLLRKRGYDCLYLGAAVPQDDLNKILRSLSPDYLFTSLIAKLDQKRFISFFEELGAVYDLNKVYVGGYQLKVFKEHLPKQVNAIHSIKSINL